MGEIVLHPNARLTPKARLEIQQSSESVTKLALKYNVTETTIRRWRSRKDDGVHDRSHTRHNLNPSTAPHEEEAIIALRRDLELSIDDITEVVKRCINPKLTRSSIYRCLKRRGVAKCPPQTDAATPRQAFDVTAEPGYIHIDVKYLTKLSDKRSYVYVAIDRATRYVYAEVLFDLETATSAGFLQRFLKHFPYKVHTILTDNGFEFTDRCSGGVKNEPTGNHAFDIVCKQNEIKHKLTKIRHPQTNGMVERFNRRINEVIQKKAKIKANSGQNSFHNHEERNEFILRFVDNYNKMRLRCLDYHSPSQKLHNHTKDNTKGESFKDYHTKYTHL